MASTLKERVSERLGELHINPFEAARRGGFEKSFVNDILIERKTSVRGSNLKKLAEALETSIGYLTGLDDHDAPLSIGGARAKRQGHKLAAGFIPEIDIKAGASFAGGTAEEIATLDGDGNAISGDVVRAEWKIPDYFLAASGMVANRTHIFPVDGPSMIPDLYPNDRVLVDLDDTNPGRDGIFAVWDGTTGTLIIKNVQVVRGAKKMTIRCISSNKNFEPFDLDLSSNSTRIIGRARQRITGI